MQLGVFNVQWAKVVVKVVFEENGNFWTNKLCYSSWIATDVLARGFDLAQVCPIQVMDVHFLYLEGALIVHIWFENPQRNECTWEGICTWKNKYNCLAVCQILSSVIVVLLVFSCTITHTWLEITKIGCYGLGHYGCQLRPSCETCSRYAYAYSTWLWDILTSHWSKWRFGLNGKLHFHWLQLCFYGSSLLWATWEWVIDYGIHRRTTLASFAAPSWRVVRLVSTSWCPNEY